MAQLRSAPSIKILSIAAAATLLFIGAAYLFWKILPPFVLVGLLIVIFIIMLIVSAARSRAAVRADLPAGCASDPDKPGKKTATKC